MRDSLHARGASLGLCALVGALAGCSATPVDLPSEPTESESVDLLDDAFVRWRGTRMPVEDFVYEMRVLCREAQAGGEVVPAVELRAPREDGRVASRTVDALQLELQAAGVRLIRLEFADS